MMAFLRRMSPRARAILFAVWVGAFYLAWSILVSNGGFVGSLVGALVGGAVAGLLFYWIENVATG